ncbi:MAG: FmdB family transcriptional regulator [Actinomycetota bacterium]|nr:FmdB family transcriptional regulator [Actinomycetota bacterium]
MPKYEYACKSCGEHLEVVQSFHDDPLTECPACGGALRKVFGAIGISFKGSGFYRTDNRSGARSDGPSKAETPSESKSDGKSDGNSDAKSDAKPAAKADAKPAASSEAKSA